LQPEFTAEPSNPFNVQEGNNITLEWSYNLTGGTFRRIEFRDHSSNPSVRILEVEKFGQTPRFLKDDYTGRLQFNATITYTSITILGANRALDSKNYEIEVVLDGANLPPSLVRVSVQCKYKSRSVLTFQYCIMCK